MKYSEWQACLREDGYVQQYPPINPNALVDGASIDRDVAERTPCPECGGKCEFHPFVAGGTVAKFGQVINRHAPNANR